MGKGRRTSLEISAVIGTALLHPLFAEVLHLRLLFICLAAGGWAIYLILRARRDATALQDWGFRRTGWGSAFGATSAFGLIALAGMGVAAAIQHSLVFRWEMLVLLALYPIWGTIQQLLVQGVFVRAATNSRTGAAPKIMAAVAAALLFGAVHLPDVALTAVTCLMGGLFALIYLRWRNLWPLGLWHGWLGVFFYYWILRRDPWAEIFGCSR